MAIIGFILLSIGWFVVFSYAVPPILQSLKKEYEAGAQWRFHWIDVVFFILASYSFYNVILRNWFVGSPAFYVGSSKILVEIIALVFYSAMLIFFGATTYIF